MAWWLVLSSPEIGGIDSSAERPPPIENNPQLDSAVRLFLQDGYPHLNDLFIELSKYRDDLSADARLILFNATGAFFHHLNENILEHDLDIIMGTATALNSVMGDAKIAKRVLSMMEGTVIDAVRRNIE